MFANSRPSASNFKSFSRSLEQLFLTVGQNNFGNKIPFIVFHRSRQPLTLSNTGKPRDQGLLGVRTLQAHGFEIGSKNIRDAQSCTNFRRFLRIYFWVFSNLTVLKIQVFFSGNKNRITQGLTVSSRGWWLHKNFENCPHKYLKVSRLLCNKILSKCVLIDKTAPFCSTL